MVPHEIRVVYDSARVFQNAAISLQNLASTITRYAHEPEHSHPAIRSIIEDAVVQTESAIKSAQIEIKRMKDEPT
jgi:hypothetical protein